MLSLILIKSAERCCCILSMLRLQPCVQIVPREPVYNVTRLKALINTKYDSKQASYALLVPKNTTAHSSRGHIAIVCTTWYREILYVGVQHSHGVFWCQASTGEAVTWLELSKCDRSWQELRQEASLSSQRPVSKAEYMLRTNDAIKLHNLVLNRTTWPVCGQVCCELRNIHILARRLIIVRVNIDVNEASFE